MERYWCKNFFKLWKTSAFMMTAHNKKVCNRNNLITKTRINPKQRHLNLSPVRKKMVKARVKSLRNFSTCRVWTKSR